MSLLRALAFLLAALSAPVHAVDWEASVPTDGGTAQALSPDGKTILVAPNSGPTLLVSTASGVTQGMLPRATPQVFSVAWGHGATWYEGTGGRADGPADQHAASLDASAHPRWLVGGSHAQRPSPDEHWLASADYSHLVVADLRGGQTAALQASLRALAGVNDLELADFAWLDANVLVLVGHVGGDYSNVHLLRIDVANRRALPPIAVPVRAPSVLLLDRARGEAWVGADEGHVLRIALATGQVLSRRQFDKAPVAALALSPAGDLATWVGDAVVITRADDPSSDEHRIAAWNAHGNLGEAPLLAWQGADLLLAAPDLAHGHGVVWRAKRVDAVIATLAGAPAEQARLLARTLPRAQAGDAGAQFLAGRMLLQGSAGDPDVPAGLAWWRKSAEAANPDAQRALADAIAKGEFDLPEDPQEAQALWRRAAVTYRAAANRGDVEAQLALGDMTARGHGVPNDPELALALLMLGKTAQLKAHPLSVDEQSNTGFWATPLRLRQGLEPRQVKRVDALVAAWRPGQPLPTDLRGADCSSLRDVQPGFDRARAQAEFADFQARLRTAFDKAAAAGIRSDDDDPDALPARMRTAFGDVVDGGRKGDALLAAIAAPDPRGIVSPMRVMIEHIRDQACPVGFGRSFEEGGRQVELWYVNLAPAADTPIGVFANEHLPAAGSPERDVYPALVFVRDERHRLRWYATSREMSTIMQAWFNRQIQ